MIFLEIIGALTVGVFSVMAFLKVYRHFVPKKYNWNNCPNDHDTMARYGCRRCDKCKNEL